MIRLILKVSFNLHLLLLNINFLLSIKLLWITFSTKLDFLFFNLLFLSSPLPTHSSVYRCAYMCVYKYICRYICIYIKTYMYMYVIPNHRFCVWKFACLLKCLYNFKISIPRTLVVIHDWKIWVVPLAHSSWSYTLYFLISVLPL